VRGITFRFDSLDGLSDRLSDLEHEQDFALPCAEGLADGEWVLATFQIGDDCTAVAGRVIDRGEGLRLLFESRDWHKLTRFAEGAGAPSIPPAAPESVPHPLAPPPNSTVLVIHDEPDLLGVLSASLKQAGYEVATCASAEEALDLLRSRPVRAILTDQNLSGGLSGTELCRRVRRDPKTQAVPVLVLTAHGSEREAAEAISAGADDYLQKPFRVRELSARVLSLVSRPIAVL
jgi:two-component system, OmpR family, phosphate regulon response regulator PhoB